MRGKNYNDGSRRLVGGKTLGIALVVVTLALALIFLLLLYLPLTDKTNNAGVFGTGNNNEWNKIVSISYEEKEIGVGSEKDKIYLTVTYDNGNKEDVPLSQMICAGLDVTTSGTQNVSLSYGGFEQTIPIVVKDVDCVLTYTASDGGRIQGESRQSIVSGHDGSTVVAVPETGYTFVEWNDGYPYATRKDKSVNETREYKAIFEKTQFVVFFFYDDGTVAREESVLYGEAATDIPKMSDPRMSVYGKTFTGWSVNEEDYKCVVRNMNIYPQYVKTATDVDLTVSSDQYGSHMGITNVNECGYYEHNSTGMITATPYNSREFDCWEVWGYTSPSSDTAEWIKIAKKLDIGESTERVYIGDNREVCVFTSNSSGNTGTEYTLTFIPNEYMDLIEIRADFVYSNSTVTFINYQSSVKNNQECVIADIPFGKTIGQSLAELYLTEEGAALKSDDETGMLLPAAVYGYKFLGWYDKLDEEQKIITVNKIFREPTSLIAKWEKLRYNVIFNYDTADNNTDSYDIFVYFQSTIGSGGGVPVVQPYRAKYDFLGWEDALTHELIDDSTQIIAKSDYLTANENFAQGRVYMVPRWQAKEHTLKVDATGSGTVSLRIHPLVGAAEEIAVSGEQIIYETYTYELVLRADVGNYVASYIYKKDNEVPVRQTSSSGLVSPVVQPTGDNYFLVTFAPIVFTATVHNGDAVYRGYVEGVSGGDEDTVSVAFNYGGTVTLNVVSPNEAYEISEIRLTGTVSGVVYNDEQVERGLEGSGTTRYKMILESCTSDLDVTVRYGSVTYAVNVRQPENGAIGTTVFNGSASDYAVAPEQKAYAPGERIFYALDASDDYYISEVRINGVRYDIYSSIVANGVTVVFYDWYVSGEFYGVTLKNIEDRFYYCYGAAEVDGAKYLLCQDIADSTRYTIFDVVDELNEKYEEISADGAVDPAYYASLLARLSELLEVNEKGIGNASYGKDDRVTSVKMMIVPEEDVNVALVTDRIYYSVTIKEDDLAVSSVTASSVEPGETVTVKTKPITGYTVVGYYRNGSLTLTPIETSTPGFTYVEDIVVRADTQIEFAYELISFTGTFTASENGSVVVSDEDGSNKKELSRSYTYQNIPYASRRTFLITAKEGKRIDSVEVNGVAYPVKNMTSYLYVCDSVKENLDVKIGCIAASSTVPVANGYELRVDGDDSHAMVSVRYGSDVYLTVLAEEGYTLSGVTIHGMKDGAEKQIGITPAAANKIGTDTTGSGVTDADFSYISDDPAYDAYRRYDKAFVLKLPGVGLFDEFAEVEISATPKECAITVISGDNGRVEAPVTAAYGESIDITVAASAYYYIESFVVGGVTIPFGSDNWTRLNYVSSVRHYNNGEYKLLVSGDTTIEAVFKRYAYTVKVDKDSVNGTTDVSVDGGVTEEDGRVPHGSTLIISMAADQGYHIKAVYVNGADAGYASYGGNENSNIIDAFTYNGPDGRGVTQNVSVRVLYEINRYSFHYTVVNDSANFAGTAGAGTLTCGYTPGAGDTYSGIAFGDNFSVIVTPATTAGYYLYSMSVTYKGYSDAVATTKTRYCTDGDGIISKSGGTVWFNRFWFAGSSALSTGVTADIENITVTFRRESYSLSFAQNSTGGAMGVSFLNPTARSGEEVCVFGRVKGTEALTTYYYIGNMFLTVSGDVGSDSNIRLRPKYDQTGTLVYVFSDGTNEYELFFEYGLRCVVSVEPETGYDTETFVVDGEDRMDYLSQNKYNFNFYRSVSVETSFIRLRFDIEVKNTVYNDKDQKIDAREGSSDYISVVISYGNGSSIVMEPSAFTVAKNLEYGTKVTIELNALFANKGVYLAELTKTRVGSDGSLITDPPMALEAVDVPDGANIDVEGITRCNVEGKIVFGPFTVTRQLSLNAVFKIRRYDVKVGIDYDEEIGSEIRNEAGQYTSRTKTDWTVYWGNNTDIGAKIDDGYELSSIVITYPNKEVVLTSDSEGNFNNTETEIYVPTSDSELSSLLTVKKIQGNVNVVFNLSRRRYVAVYSVDNKSYVEALTTYYNENNRTYPKSTRDWNLNSVQDTRYYDELRVMITPKDGYEIVAERISIYRAEKDARTEEWKRKEGTGAIITLDFATVVNDTKQFTFHPADTSAQMVVTGDIIVDISVTIKRYRLETEVDRLNAAADASTEKNNTEVSLKVYVAPGNYAMLDVNGSLQREQFLRKGDGVNQSVAQHGSLIEYEFVTPEGYRMDKFSVNGLDLQKMITAGYASLVASKYEYDVKRYYYKVSLVVCTEMVNGEAGFIKSSSNLLDVSISIRPIVYDIVIYIDNDQKSFDTFGGRSGVTDGEKLTVYSANNVVHFSSVTIEPMLFEGYQIDETNALVGFQGGLVDASQASFGAEQMDIKVRRLFTFNATTLKNADATTGKTVVYFTFKASIIKYNFKLTSIVYYSENDTYKESALADYNSQNASPAGAVRYSVNDTEYEMSDANRTLDYFTEVTVSSAARQGFAVFAVYEKVNGVWQMLMDNVNEIALAATASGYDFSFMVNGIGSREFRIDFKQKTSIVVNIPNPYKYVSGVSSSPYLYYSEIKAYESDVETETGNLIEPLPPENPLDKVVTKYVFDVYVGNYFSVWYTDPYRYSGANRTVNFTAYTRDMSEVAEECIAHGFDGGVFDPATYKTYYDDVARQYAVDGVVYGGDKDGKRYHIIDGREFYLYDNDVYGRVSATKETFDATSESGTGNTISGGKVYYNNNTSESRENVIYEDVVNGTTKEGRVLTIVCEPNANYAFYRLRLRQINVEASKKAGYVVFGSTDTTDYFSINYDEVLTSAAATNAVDRFNDINKNQYVLLNCRYNSANGRYYFSLWMNGDVEVVAEYYRTYNVTFARYLPDEIANGGAPSSDYVVAADRKDIVYTLTSGSETVGPFKRAKDAGESTVRISYGSEFSMTVTPPTTSNYVFVGWYINDVNLYEYLDSLTPNEDYYVRSFTADLLNMPSLMANGYEVTDIVIYARFEPIIDVRLINEKFYAYDYHFNSWDMGTVQSLYYSYSRSTNIGIPLSTHAILVNDEAGSSIASAIDRIKQSEGYDGYGWSDLCSDPVVASYSSEFKNNNVVHSAFATFSVLMENVVDSEFVRNTWETSAIELYMILADADIAFSSWQYYNWNTHSWTTIDYEYINETMGASADGSDYWTDAHSQEYIFSLSALYAARDERGQLIRDGMGALTYKMPYAISSTRADNIGGDRPLMIRPDVYKFFTVQLQQFAFSATDEKRYENGLADVDERELNYSYVYPTINSYEDSNSMFGERNTTNDDMMSGTYEYGTTLRLLRNTENSGEEVYDDGHDTRYRFIGWHTKIGNTMYFLNGSAADEFFNYKLICAPNSSNTTLTLKSYYVAQYKQTFHSYNISGSSADYTNSMKTFSGQAAPQANITAADTANVIHLDAVSVNASGAVKYNQSGSAWSAEERNDHYDYYQISSTEDNPANLSNGSAFDSGLGWAFEYFIDAGLDYQVHVKKSNAISSTNDIKTASNRNNGFNPEFDTLYKLLENKRTAQDFSSYYNTGKGTYWKNGAAVTPSHLTSVALSGVAEWEAEGNNSKKTYSSTTQHAVELQYVSTAVLIFYNMLYDSGISLVDTKDTGIIEKLTGGGKTRLTVWDTSTLYGDWTDEGETPSYFATPNGEVVIRITLVNVGTNGYTCKIRYALKGMQEGYGIEGRSEIYDASNTTLFSPKKSGYGRWFEYDLNNYYQSGKTDISNTRVFGEGGFLSNTDAHKDSVARSQSINDQVGKHKPTPDCYNTANCGNGTSGAPYRIYVKNTSGNVTQNYTDNTQLNFVDVYWRNNGYSCNSGEENVKTCFKVYGINTTLINLQNIAVNTSANTNPQGTSSVIWTPLCGTSDSDDGENIRGFDGRIDFSGFTVYGLAVGTGATYTGLYYGLFGKVVGGDVFGSNTSSGKMTFRNGYFQNYRSSVTYLGLVCGYADNASFQNIDFALISSSNSYSGVRSYTNNGNNAQIYMAGPDHIGALVGYGRNSIYNNITLNSNSAGSMYVEVAAGIFGGTLIGAAEGGSITNVTVNGSTWLVSGVVDIAEGAAGGLFGYIGGELVLQDRVLSTKSPLTAYSIKLTGTPTIIVGNDASNVSGGIVGMVGQGATIRGITMTTNCSQGNLSFTVNEDNGQASPGNIMLRANHKSVSSSAMKSLTGYGFVGAIAGVNYGIVDGTGTTINSFVYTHSGTAGGAVGANFGTVRRLSFSSYFRLYAWEPSDTTYSFNYGGVVGYNFGGASATMKYVSGGEVSAFQTTFSGLIHDCSLTGNDSAGAAYTGTAGWNAASVYVFTRSSDTDTTYTGGSKFITTTAPIENKNDSNYGSVTNSNNYEKSQNYLRMGGICGYSSGRIYNAVVKNTRISTYRWRFSYDKSPVLGAYAWAVQAGMVCGYFDPETSSIQGFTGFGTNDGSLYDLNAPELPKYINTNRIQSCLVDNCSVNVNGNVWMDDMWDAAGPTEGVGDDTSLAAGVSVAGIVGGVNGKVNMNDFAVNTCKVTKMRFYVVFQAYGRQDTGSGGGKSYGWKFWSRSHEEWRAWPPGKYTVTNYYAVCLRTYCLIEASANLIASGLRTPASGVADADIAANYCLFTPSENTKTFTNETVLGSGTYKDLGESSQWFGLGDASSGDISAAWVRYINYNGMSKGKFDSGTQNSGNIKNDFDRQEVASMPEQTGLSFGFYNRNVVKTDPETGYWLACECYGTYASVEGNKIRLSDSYSGTPATLG